MRVVSKYEVACRACGVKYPPGQKRCVHCGGRTEKSIVEMPDAPPELMEAVGHAEPEPQGPLVFSGEGREMVFMPGEPDAELEEARGGWLRRLGGLVWIVLFVVFTAIRMCSEGGK